MSGHRQTGVWRSNGKALETNAPMATGKGRAQEHGGPSAGEVIGTPPRPPALVWLHWLTVLFALVAAAVIFVRNEAEDRDLRFWLLEIHRHVGLAVLALFALRLLVRLRAGTLSAGDRLAWPLRAAATLTHLSLYACLLVLPMLGWLLSDALGHPVHLFGLTLPHLVQSDDDLADRALAWHQDAAWVLLWLALLHTAAALWHHVVLRDGVLRSMLPRRRR